MMLIYAVAAEGESFESAEERRARRMLTAPPARDAAPKVQIEVPRARPSFLSFSAKAFSSQRQRTGCESARQPFYRRTSARCPAFTRMPQVVEGDREGGEFVRKHEV